MSERKLVLNEKINNQVETHNAVENLLGETERIFDLLREDRLGLNGLWFMQGLNIQTLQQMLFLSPMRLAVVSDVMNREVSIYTGLRNFQQELYKRKLHGVPAVFPYYTPVEVLGNPTVDEYVRIQDPIDAANRISYFDREIMCDMFGPTNYALVDGKLLWRIVPIALTSNILIQGGEQINNTVVVTSDLKSSLNIIDANCYPEL